MNQTEQTAEEQLEASYQKIRRFTGDPTTEGWKLHIAVNEAMYAEVVYWRTNPAFTRKALIARRETAGVLETMRKAIAEQHEKEDEES